MEALASQITRAAAKVYEIAAINDKSDSQAWLFGSTYEQAWRKFELVRNIQKLS